MTEVHTGTIKWYGGNKEGKDPNYGFITPDEAGPDMHIHQNVVTAAGLETLDTGQRVAYQTTTFGKPKRPTATNLEVFTDAPLHRDVTQGVVTSFSWCDNHPHGFIHCDLLGPVDIYISGRQLTDMESEEAAAVDEGTRLCFTLIYNKFKGSMRFRAQNASISNMLSVPLLVKA